jgi:hypothetical protein
MAAIRERLDSHGRNRVPIVSYRWILDSAKEREDLLESFYPIDQLL